jgi:RimJ/RimL family protein N-acetyltransferase
MSDIPLTRNITSKQNETHIRNAVKVAENLAGMARLARKEDAVALTTLLEDPNISDPIYTLPKQINVNTIGQFIEDHLEERERGEGLLMIGTDDDGSVHAYHDLKIWPHWAACELGGGIRQDRQNSGQGGAGALRAFSWLFEVIGVDLICETAALDNIRTAKLLDRIGFTYKGEIRSTLPDGGIRPSKVWELERSNWSNKLESN